MACVCRTFNHGVVRVFLILALLSHQHGVHPFRPPPRPRWRPVGVPQRLGASTTSTTFGAAPQNFTSSSSGGGVDVPLATFKAPPPKLPSANGGRKYTRPGKAHGGAHSFSSSGNSGGGGGNSGGNGDGDGGDGHPGQVIFSKRFEALGGGAGSDGTHAGGPSSGHGHGGSGTGGYPPGRRSKAHNPPTPNILASLTEPGRRPWKSRKDPSNPDSVGVYPTNFYRNIAYDHLATSR